jgi:F-type H+-transporting ATPase subunit epsilon
MRVTVISPDRAVYEGDADAVVAPAYDGQVGILPRHAPFLTLLGEGRLRVQAAGRTHAFRVRGGFLQVIDNHVRIVAEQVDEGA